MDDNLNLQTNELDNMLKVLANTISGPSVPGSHYTPAPTRPDITPTGGIVATVRRYSIIVDSILIPNMGDRPVNAPQTMSGDVTEADLNSAKCNIDYLVSMGHIVENGFMQV